MIFGGSDAIWSKRQHKVCYREACAAETAVTSFLSRSESPITFDQRDHPSCVARPGRYPLVIDPIVRKKRLTKVLMDGGSGLNILYVDTLDAMCIPRSELRGVSSPFHGMILGTQAYPLEQIDQPVMFGDRANFRSEVLTFEVVDFLGSYHAILGSHATPSSWWSPTTPISS